jgi:hypothetical protein
MVKTIVCFSAYFRQKAWKKPSMPLGRDDRIPYVSIPGVQSRDPRPLYALWCCLSWRMA